MHDRERFLRVELRPGEVPRCGFAPLANDVGEYLDGGGCHNARGGHDERIACDKRFVLSVMFMPFFVHIFFECLATTNGVAEGESTGVGNTNGFGALNGDDRKVYAFRWIAIEENIRPGDRGFCPRWCLVLGWSVFR